MKTLKINLYPEITTVDLVNHLISISPNKTIHSAAEYTGIPYTTLLRYVNGKSKIPDTTMLMFKLYLHNSNFKLYNAIQDGMDVM